MRLLPALLAAGAFASCNAPDQGNRATPSNAVEARTPMNESTPMNRSTPSGSASAAASTATTIPPAFLGVYDRSVEECARTGEYRMEIGADRIRFHESIGKVRSVAFAAADRISVTADYQGEGESWHSVRELRLSGGGGTLTVSGEGTEIVRRRCPDSAPH